MEAGKIKSAIIPNLLPRMENLNGTLLIMRLICGLIRVDKYRIYNVFKSYLFILTILNPQT